tara:strand:- start:1563 stop:2207 length:645 start_codon:yes stop_codon:yes gene_type:complete
MDEEIAIINENTRYEKIKNFFINNKNKLITIFIILVLLLFSYLFYKDFEKKNKVKLSDKYNKATADFIAGNKLKVESDLIEIINKKDTAYSPLALYFLVDNKIINKRNKVNELFDIVINETSLEKEIKNLIIYKKALYNADFETENNLIEMLKPITNSESIWKSHGLYLLGEYFYSKNEKQKSKDFFSQIISLENSNNDIRTEAQKRLNRDFSE